MLSEVEPLGSALPAGVSTAVVRPVSTRSWASPAQDYFDGEGLDLNAHLVTDHVATFFLRVTGSGMSPWSVHDGDIVIMDTALRPIDGDIVVAAFEGELVIRRLRLGPRGAVALVSPSPGTPPIFPADPLDLVIRGVVTYSIHAHRAGRHA